MVPSFPPSLDRYQGEAGLSLWGVLASRVRAEPLNLVATVLFVLAILHTFAASRFTAWSHRLREAEETRPAAPAADDQLEAEPSHALHFRAEVLHFLGEIEVVFGLWVIPLLIVVALSKGWTMAEAFVSHGVDFTEPAFVTVVMALSSTRPVLEFAEAVVGRVAALGRRTPTAWWLAILIVTPVLGSFITEPAAMIIGALLLARQVFEGGPSLSLRYATLGLLFTSISVGGTLTHFAAPPVVMVASRWGWDTGFMARTFGWKALLGIVVATALYAAWFRRELGTLPPAPPRAARGQVPAWVIAVHLGFLAWAVLVSHTVALFVGGFLVFLAFTHATAPYQSPLNLRPALLVGFFLAGLVVHGALQQWWIEPVLGRLPALPLFAGAMGLTAFNDNAAITYLASLVPGFTPELRYAVTAGAIEAAVDAVGAPPAVIGVAIAALVLLPEASAAVRAALAGPAAGARARCEGPRSAGARLRGQHHHAGHRPHAPDAGRGSPRDLRGVPAPDAGALSRRPVAQGLDASRRGCLSPSVGIMRMRRSKPRRRPGPVLRVGGSQEDG